MKAKYIELLISWLGKKIENSESNQALPVGGHKVSQKKHRCG